MERHGSYNVGRKRKLSEEYIYKSSIRQFVLLLSVYSPVRFLGTGCYEDSEQEQVLQSIQVEQMRLNFKSLPCLP